MQDPNDTLWNEFQVRRERYTKQAEEARLINEGKSRETADAQNQGRLFGRLALAAVRFLLHWHRGAPDGTRPIGAAGSANSGAK